MNMNQMRVILGASSLKAYVAAPKAFHVIGVVRFGMEYGLLATNAAGLYFRVNGSQVATLNTRQVRRAIDVCQHDSARHFGANGGHVNNRPYAEMDAHPARSAGIAAVRAAALPAARAAALPAHDTASTLAERSSTYDPALTHPAHFEMATDMFKPAAPRAPVVSFRKHRQIPASAMPAARAQLTRAG